MVRKKRMRTRTEILLKVGLPVLILIGILITIGVHRLNINAELPVDYNPDPWSSKSCDIAKPDEKKPVPAPANPPKD